MSFNASHDPAVPDKNIVGNVSALREVHPDPHAVRYTIDGVRYSCDAVLEVLGRDENDFDRCAVLAHIRKRGLRYEEVGVEKKLQV